MYAEVIGNPSGAIADLAGLADVAHGHGVPFVVDATLATPYLCRPMEHGADIVVHSATKFIGGHGTSIGGVVVESGRFDWANGRFPLMTEPVASYGGLSWWGNFAEYGFLTRLRAEQLRDVGATMTPFNAFLFLLGLETLPLRMAAHVANAAVGGPLPRGAPGRGLGGLRRAALVAVARAGPALPAARTRERSSPSAWPAGASAASASSSACELASHLANVGDARTLVIHPASTTHAQLRRRRARRGRRLARAHPPLGRHRGPRRHLPRPRPGAAGGGRMTAWVNPGAKERQRIIAGPGPWPSSVRRPTRRAPATSS